MSKSRANFVRLAENRTTKILKNLDLLSNLSNKTNYTYDEDDIKKIMASINKSIKECERKFQQGLSTKKDRIFKL